jgi:hypothetical protein
MTTDDRGAARASAGEMTATAPAATAGTRRRHWLPFAATWVAALVFLAGDVWSILAMGLFLAGLVLPCWLLLAAGFVRLLKGEGGARLLGASATLILLAPLYLLRKIVPLPSPVTDLLLASLAWVLAWRMRAIRRLLPSVRSLLTGSERVWVGVVLPAVFCLTWLGYGVKSGPSVKYLGLYLIDFGNLLSVQNLVRIGDPLPMSAVVHMGPLAYHWLYFAFPAWSSEFLGISGRGGSALVMANLITGSLFYLALARACARVLRTAAAFAADSARLAPHLAGVGLFSLSTLYAYQTAVGQLHQSWLTLGTRNHLLLQLPHSLTCFGNNTLALTMTLLVIDLLGCWSSSGKRGCLGVAAVLASLLPGYSVTLVFPLGLAIVAWSLSGRARRPVFALSVFGAFAAVAFVLFRSIGLFSSGGGGGRLMLSFDGGQFVQNLALGFLPATVALGICLWSGRNRGLSPGLFPFLCLALACLFIPTVSMTRGAVTSRVDFSMKTASLYLVAVVPFFASASAWLISRPRRHWGVTVAGIALIGAGLVNSGAYVVQHAFHRVLGRYGDAPSISVDHYRALELVAHYPSRLVLVDELSMPYPMVDPAVMLGGKRVLVPSAFEEMVSPPSVAGSQSKALWRAWQSSRFGDETLSLRFAEKADILIAASLVRSPSWRPVATFGEVTVYCSIPRQNSPASVPGGC